MTPDLSFGEDEYTLVIVRDGTTTKVQIKDADGVAVGEGISRRAKGDRRNQGLGDILAMARAFEDVAETCYEAATEMGWGQARLSFTQEEVALIKESLAALAKLGVRSKK